MRLTDCLRLGWAEMVAHKRRTVMVIIVVGALFSVVVAGILILQGVENVVLGAMLESTDGEVWVSSSVDTDICGRDCEAEVETAEMLENIMHYGGEIVPVKLIQMAEGDFLMLRVDEKNNSEEIPMAVPVRMAMKLIDAKLLGQGATMTERMSDIQRTYDKVLGKTFSISQDERYLVDKILPGSVYVDDLSLGNVGDNNNPLNLVLGQIETGASQNLILNDVEIEGSQLGEEDIIVARFPNIVEAYEYYKDEANYCAKTDRVFGVCGKNYKYKVESIISNPLGAYEVLQNVWQVVSIIIVLLVVIAATIALGTYIRIIGQDAKKIRLYRAMGATKGQLRLTYLVYLEMMSVAVVGFVALVGVFVAVLVSLVNMGDMIAVFALGLGVIRDQIWLLGWNWMLCYIMGVIVGLPVIAILLAKRTFAGED